MLFSWGSCNSDKRTFLPWQLRVMRRSSESHAFCGSCFIQRWREATHYSSESHSWRSHQAKVKPWSKQRECFEISVSWPVTGACGAKIGPSFGFSCPAAGNNLHETAPSRGAQHWSLEKVVQSGSSAYMKPPSGMSLRSWITFWAPIPVKEEFIDVMVGLSSSKDFTWEGWGTSLCWWANFVGGLPEDDMNFILDLLFDEKKGLGLTIARYNIGGGANPTFDTHLRPFGDVPGFKGGPSAAYDWSADERQRKVLLGAIHRGVNVTEAFSNSPPHWMTFSGSVTGNKWWGQENLKPVYHEAFADYITEVVKQYQVLWGIKFDYLAAFNEPVEGWWYINKRKESQEGCNFSVKSAEKVILHLKDCLQRKGLCTKVSGFDAWTKNTVPVLNALGPEALAVLQQVNVHSYINNVRNEQEANRLEVREAVGRLKKKLWMSEYGPLNWSGDELDIALGVAKHVTLDLNELQPAAWCYWQVLEDPGGGAWGLLQAPFRYQNSPINVQLRKQYFALMHFTRWIRPGFQILVHDLVRSFLVIARDPAGNNIIVVATNPTDSNKDIRYDASAASISLKAKALQVALFRTDAMHNHVELPRSFFDNSVVSVRCVAKSITTMIISALK